MEALRGSERAMTAAQKAAEKATKQLRRSVGNTVAGHGAYFGIGTDYEYASRAREQLGRFETFAVRNKSIAAREPLARSATNMQFGVRDTIRTLRVLRAGRIPGSMDILRKWHAPSLLSLARLIANQNQYTTDTADAELLFRFVKEVHGDKALGKNDVYMYAECLADLGQHGQAYKAFTVAGMHRRDPVHHQLLKANAAREAGMDTEVGRANWAAVISEVLAADGRAPVSIGDPGDGTLFDALRAEAEPRHVDGPRVTVLVPSFNGSDFLETTLRCLVRQTWKDLEIIVVDDGSDEPHRRMTREACERYGDDVIFVQQPENLGAYCARNRGLELSTGEYITVHDDDDWSHPEKIEVQVRDLLERGPRSANMTRHVRTAPSLRMARINNNPSFSQGNFSSLMFHRSILEEVGVWDDVNRGADAEFRDRLVKVIGEPVEILGDAPLSFTRTHEASLTSNEIGRGYLDPARLLYQASYQRAHAQRDIDGENSWDTTFVRPANMAPGARGKHLGTFDVVFATDFRFPGGTSSLTLNEIETASLAGKRVGVLQLDSALNHYAAPIADRLFELASAENVELLSLKDAADVPSMIIRHPSVLQFLDNQESALRIGALTVIVNNPPVLTGGTGIMFSFEDVRRNAYDVFGVVPEVIAESGVTKEQCLRVAPIGSMDEGVWPGSIDIERFVPTEPRNFDRKPVLGRHSRDNQLKWPDRAEDVYSVYEGGEDFDVRILGGVNSLPSEVADRLRRDSDVIEFGDADPSEFLTSLDFWAYFHSDSLTESFGMATVEAMASGLVVFLPHYMEPTFGEGAQYAEPHEVRERIMEIWADPNEYRRLSELARKTAEERFSARALLERMDVRIERGRNTLEADR
ncbi:glycosyltransferase [Brevibacterium luteolum]|nr:glycosyltransferase [Brevibacterium luteolum]